MRRPAACLIALVIFIALIPAATVASTNDPPQDEPGLNVLVITGGGYHDFAGNTAALLDGVTSQRGAELNMRVLWLGSDKDAPEQFQHSIDLHDPDLFQSHDVVLAYCQGELGFTDDIQRRFLRYIRNGGGYVAIHSAADSHPGWSEYDVMLGGRFESHPPVSEFAMQIDDTDHPVTRGLPAEWTLTDEFYHLTENDAHDKTILMRGRSPGDDADAPLRPVTWVKRYDAGRVFYTILGHGRSTHRDEHFHTLIGNALRWAAEEASGDDMTE